jgi:C4-dicarboxylate-specific signal transduction histidine kinase
MAEVLRIEYLFDMFKSYNRYEKPVGIPVRIDQFIERFTSLVEADFAEKGIEIKREIPSGEHWACIDLRALHQVMLNLFTNAADAVAGADHPEIRVALKARRSCMEMAITDNGCGMTDGEMKTLFQPFCTSKPKGNGIGLAIVKKMLSELHCGILIHSEKNKGTTVSVHIPLCPP